MTNKTFDKYATVPMRVESDGQPREISEIEQRVLSQMAHLQNGEKPYILTVVFDGTNHRVYVGDQKAFVSG